MVSRSRSLCLAIHGDVCLYDMGEDRDIARHRIAGITAASRTEIEYRNAAERKAIRTRETGSRRVRATLLYAHIQTLGEKLSR
jgi:hypothetical protein